MLESIYYAITWGCRRACAHCYDERFRKYDPAELEKMLIRGREVFPHVVRNLPDALTYTDMEDQREDGSFPVKNGRIILSGGEVLMEPVRNLMLYPLLETLRDRYDGRARLVIQTAGDLLTSKIIDELLKRDVWMISVSSMDDFHFREGDKAGFRQTLTRMFEDAGMRQSGLSVPVRKWRDEEGPVYSFFGATPDAWIGKLWPGGRAWENGLSTAQYQDNFCDNWSGGLNFLNLYHSGSEVSIDPEGNVYPCCRKTRLPYGNLCEEPLGVILERLIGLSELEAITNGHPERMGLVHGVGVADFIALCRVVDPKGRVYVNRCIGCDRVHERFLGPVLNRLRRERRA